MENDSDQPDMPQVKEVRPYVLRHSLTTLVRNRGATRWDLEGFMGHRSSSLRSANIRPSSPPRRASFPIWKPSHPAHCAGTAREQTSPAHSREAEKCCHNNDLERCAYRTHIFRCRPQKISGFCQRRNSWPPRGPHQIRSHFWRRTCVDWDTVHCI